MVGGEACRIDAGKRQRRCRIVAAPRQRTQGLVHERNRDGSFFRHWLGIPNEPPASRLTAAIGAVYGKFCRPP